MKGLVPEELPKRLPLAGPDEKWGEKWGVEVKSGGGSGGWGVGRIPQNRAGGSSEKKVHFDVVKKGSFGRTSQGPSGSETSVRKPKGRNWTW